MQKSFQGEIYMYPQFFKPPYCLTQFPCCRWFETSGFHISSIILQNAISKAKQWSWSTVLYIRDKHTPLMPEATSPAMQMYFTFMVTNFSSIALRTSLWRKNTMNLLSIPWAKSSMYLRTGPIYRQQVKKAGWWINVSSACPERGLAAQMYRTCRLTWTWLTASNFAHRGQLFYHTLFNN